MGNFILYFLFFTLIFPILSYVPEWNLTSSGIDLLQNSRTKEYLVVERDMYQLNTKLFRNVTMTNSNILIKHRFEATYSGTTVSGEVDFDNIESSYKERLTTPVICPKGKYHMYDIEKNQYIIPNDFEEKGDWELKCFMQRTNYFLVLYKMNGEYNFYATTSDVYNLTRINGVFGEELYDFILRNEINDKEPFGMASIIKLNNNLVLKGSYLYNTKGINITEVGSKILTDAKKYSQVVFQNYSDNFYFFTYNNVSDFTCGYTSQYADKNYYHDVSKYEIVKYSESPLIFEGNVEILEMNFSLYNKYAFYKIYNKDKNITYNGVIDVTLNKIIFNTNEEVQSFSAYSNNAMLAIVNNKAYKICGIKNQDETDCADSCESGKSPVLDLEKGTICGSGCEGKYKLIPSEACSSNCDLYKFIYNGTYCGECKYFYENKIYKFYNDTTSECLETIPEGTEEFDTDFHLLQCKSGYIFNGSTCITNCYETCLRCSEYSTNEKDQKCLSCIGNYSLINGNCIQLSNCLSQTQEKCATCNAESNLHGLCISCNNNYLKANYTIIHTEFLDCFKEGDNSFINFYYDNDTDQYRPCYQTCKRCLKPGNRTSQNCLECKFDFMLKPFDNPYNNCVPYTEYYYRDSFDRFKNLDIFQCPEEAKYSVKEKNFCIDDCKKNSDYKNLYNGNCVENCPSEETTNINNVCKVNPNKCILGRNIIYLKNNNLDFVDTLVKRYSSEFNYTDNFISLFENTENTNYTIIIYKNAECIKELGLTMPYIIFNECYKKLQRAYGITENLIVSLASKFENKQPVTITSLYHPKSGLKLDAENICRNDSVTIWGNLESFFDKSDELKHYLLKQGVNIFDSDSDFFTDICYDFDNPLGKDITLNDRVKLVFSDVTLCEKGCDIKGINYENMSVECDCSFNDIANNEIINDNAFLSNTIGEVFELISSSNIFVFKCTKYIFKYFTRSIGSFLSLCAIASHIGLTLLYFLSGRLHLKIYFFSMTNSYLLYIKKIKKMGKNKNKEKHSPTKRGSKMKGKKSLKSDLLASKDMKSFNMLRQSKANLGLNKRKSTFPMLIHNNIKNNNEKKNEKEIKIEVKKRVSKFNSENDENFISNDIFNKKNMNKYFEEFMETNPDDMEYDDAIVLDKRKFCECLKENIKENQIIANTFITEDPLKPRSIKIMVFMLNLLLYFVVDALFINEEVVAEIFQADEEEENFFSYLGRSIDEIFYAALVSIVIGMVEDFFFVEEKKIKGIFKREKDNQVNLKKEMLELLKDIQKRNFSFIIIVSIIILLSFYYLLCFNYAFPYTQIEWIKSSVTIIIFMQTLSVLRCIISSGLRFLSFKFKNERLYKYGKFLD